ncbi:hypothetical protein [Halovivax gelatinilyticus]|uniref:hypothetical protein n=1 Tax=Halovivax gelatinilyticus TaxID=2961597 RepID=UPI0020CA29E1|nr:hypothetical protein [Halovivax gelatinilyticus]
MNVRDAREADASALASIAGAPTDVLGDLIHDRTVRIAEDVRTDPTVDAERTKFSGENPENILGFVSFDADSDVVTVTKLDGTKSAYDRLLDEPIGFARTESMGVEALVTADRTDVVDALEAKGFSRVEEGPRFEGADTVLFRLELR